MKINTKVVFEWNPESKQYEEIYCDSYDYDGEVSECQNWYNQLYNQLFGGGSRWGSEYQPFGSYRQFTPVPEDSFSDPMAPFDALNPNPLAQSLTPYQTTDYGAIPERGPQAPAGSTPGEGFGKAMTKAQFGQRAQGLSEGVMEGGLFRKGSTGINLENIFDKGRFSLSGVKAGKELPGAAAKEGASSIFGSAAAQGGMMAGGGLLGGITGYMQAKSQQKGLSKAIGELDPIKTQALGAYKRSLGLAESYRPGGTYSRYMGGKILSQAEESVGQETSRMIASGITSPSMMRQIGHQSRRQSEASLPGMEMQISQMALPYEQLASGYFGEYRGLSEQLSGLKGARGSINPWTSAVSGAMSGAMGAATMIASLASDRRMKKDIKYLHTSNEGHKVYSFKYKDGDTKYSGVMAQDVLKINPNAVTLKNGMLAVYYDMIDVDMQQLDIIQ
jgi:hypothetical protein